MDAQRKLEFFEFVGDQWGRERAGQLMELLPTVPGDELVTKQYLSQELAIVRAEVRQQVAEVRQEMAEGFADVHRGFAGVQESFARVYEKMADQTRTIVIAMVTLWLSGMALAFTAARLAS